MNQQQEANIYQPLFDLLCNEHDLILTISEMDEIIKKCNIVKTRYTDSGFHYLQHYFKADKEGSRFCICGQYFTSSVHFNGF